MTCPYPPSDPVCQQGPTTTTTLQHVVIDNFYGHTQDIETSTDAVQTAIQHQTHVMVIGFTAVVLVIVLVGAAIAAGIHDYLRKQAE